MKFFNLKELAQSWSVWAASVVTVTPLIDMNSGLFSFIPEQYKAYVVSALGIIVLIARAIKQPGLSK